mgnify:CR=1 FL=1
MLFSANCVAISLNQLIAMIMSNVNAARYGIDKDRAVNYNADGQGTHIVYNAVAKAVCDVRASAPLSAEWSEEINADYQRRGKKK